MVQCLRAQHTMNNLLHDHCVPMCNWVGEQENNKELQEIGSNIRSHGHW